MPTTDPPAVFSLTAQLVLAGLRVAMGVAT